MPHITNYPFNLRKFYRWKDMDYWRRTLDSCLFAPLYLPQDEDCWRFRSIELMGDWPALPIGINCGAVTGARAIDPYFHATADQVCLASVGDISQELNVLGAKAQEKLDRIDAKLQMLLTKPDNPIKEIKRLLKNAAQNKKSLFWKNLIQDKNNFPFDRKPPALMAETEEE